MALVTLKAVLDHSREKGYAVGAFNFNGIEDARGIIEAAEEKNSPVILMASTSAVKYFGGAKPCAAYIKALADESSAPIVLHVDHCTDLQMIKDCVEQADDTGSFQFLVLSNAQQPEIIAKFGLTLDACIEYDFADAKANTVARVEKFFEVLGTSAEGADPERFKTAS